MDTGFEHLAHRDDGHGFDSSHRLFLPGHNTSVEATVERARVRGFSKVDAPRTGSRRKCTRRPGPRPTGQARGWVPLYTLTSRSLLTWVYTWVVWRLE